MRMSTRVWALFESKGRPGVTLRIEDESVAAMIKALVGWLAESTMGHYMRITIARSAEELNQLTASGSAANLVAAADVAAEIDSMLEGLLDDELELESESS